MKAPIQQIWYNHRGVQHEIVKQLRRKELSILGGGVRVRWICAKHLGTLQSTINFFDLNERKTNLYASLDNYNYIPYMSFNFKKRKQESDKWLDIVDNHRTGYDFGIDLDAKEGTWKDCIKDAIKLKMLFDEYSVRYSVWMSGEHGFHFIIPYEDIAPEISTEQFDIEETLAFYRSFASILASEIRHIDESIYTSSRPFKLAYSLTKDDVPIYPLNDDEFIKLTNGKEKEVLDPYRILSMNHIGYRGTVFRGNKEGIRFLLQNWEGWKNGI